MRVGVALCAGMIGCQGPSPAAGHNVVLITLDTVRADHLGTYGYADARTPAIDALAARGTVFETAIAVAPITMPAHSSLFTGLYPMHHGVRDNGSFVLDPSVQTLAEQFRAAGYDTGAVVSAMVLDSKYGLDQGFRVYDDDLYAGGTKKLFMYQEVRADVSVDKALKLVQGELKAPWFLWVHLFDAHADYTPPPPYDVLFLDRPYDGEIAWLDSQVGRLVGAVDDQTVVVLAADHGESLGDHGEQTHGIFVYRSTTHVPLVVAGPGVAVQRVPGVVSQVDVAPTLTALAGVPSLGDDGVSLARTLLRGAAVPSRDGVYAESMNPMFQFGWHELRALDAGSAKVIAAPRPEAYDLVADPGETRNLWPDGAGPMAALDALVAGDDVSQARPEIDEATRAMLEELGYTGDLGPSTTERPDPKDVAHRWVDLQICHALVRASRLPEAKVCLERLLTAEPDHWAARLSLAGVYRNLGDPAAAEKVIRYILAADPEQTDALLSLGQALGDQGDGDGAEGAYRSAAASAPNDPKPWVRLGELYQASGRTEDAVRAYGEALRRDEMLVDAYVGLGNAFHREGDSARALTYLQRAVELDPHDLVAWYNLGVVEDALGQYADAEIAYKKALEVDPQHALTHNNLGSLYKRVGRLDEAESQFKLALAADPDHVEARYNLGSMYVETHPDVAVSLLLDVVEAHPDLLPARQNLAVAYTRLGRPDEAIAQYAWIAEHTTDPWAACLAIASIEAGRGRTERARQLVRDALSAGGDEARDRVRKDPKLAPFAG